MALASVFLVGFPSMWSYIFSLFEAEICLSLIHGLQFRVLRIIALYIREEIFGSPIIVLANWLLLNTTGPVLLMFYYLDIFLTPSATLDSAPKSQFYTGAFNFLHFIFYKAEFYTYFLFLHQWKPMECSNLSLHCNSGSMVEHRFPKIRPLHTWVTCITCLVPMNNFFPLLACCSDTCPICVDMCLTQILRVCHATPYSSLIIGYSNKCSL